MVWFSVILQVKLRIISFPVREFPRATDIGFTITYLLYPILISIYILLEPRRSRAIRTLYLLLWCAALAWLNDMINQYTQLLEYKFLDWFMGSMFFIFLLALTKVIVRWFYRYGEQEAYEAEMEEVKHEQG
ncbi:MULTISPECIES: CBO0543 family protein [unclassified Paenibacillus]|uniref:CBO0543 family protein n=1 Tax=unclassified Paenibacillus TaxID=185978 RepID=UPI002AA2AC9E|nr:MULTISPECIES: CBO0543 family protein [unclassified Paenibacillus]